MGTSVKVEKYINAPKTAASRLFASEFPPTHFCTAASGKALLMIPAINTPANKMGTIFFRSFQVSPIQLEISTLSNQRTVNHIIAASNKIANIAGTGFPEVVNTKCPSAELTSLMTKLMKEAEMSRAANKAKNAEICGNECFLSSSDNMNSPFSFLIFVS